MGRKPELPTALLINCPLLLRKTTFPYPTATIQFPCGCHEGSS